MIRTCVLAVWVAVMLSSNSASSDLKPAAEGNGAESAESLRANGPAGLAEVLARRDELVERRAASGPQSHPHIDRELAALDLLIDEVGAQKWCTASRLFWYTALDKARAASRESGKPILSLRMMGKLTDEYSCANSRFFRATLYANRAVADLMRERFVLHWASVRPVPRVTIDFGDGRRLHRTLTGNSIHYVLDSRGRVIDGLPGLHSPQRFQRWLTQMAHMAAAMATVTGRDAAQRIISNFHVHALDHIARQWESDVERVGAQAVSTNAARDNDPPAEAAMRRARTKAKVEMPMLPAVTMKLARIESKPGAEAWDRIGGLHLDDVRFDDDTIAFIKRLNPVAGRTDNGDSVLDRLLGQLRLSVAADSVRNEYELHRQIHQWLAESPSLVEIESFNERVYDEVFLTPRRDPWIGLLPQDAFAAIVDNGVEESR